MVESLPLPASRSASARAASLIDRLFPQPRNFDVRLSDGSLLQGAATPAFTLVLRHPGALRRMVRPPIELSMGEAFIYGDFDIEGDIFSVFSLIDTAQERKLDYICRKLRLRPGERLLDIGCGWGGLAAYAAERHNVEVLGVTLSPQQVDYARARPVERVRVEVFDYRDLAAESFDK